MTDGYLAPRAAADVDAFATLLGRPTTAETADIISSLGEDCYKRLRDLALRTPRGDGHTSRGNVVVIHGLMGSELFASRAGADRRDRIWLDATQLASGGMTRLTLAPDGQTAAEPGTTVETGGILSRHYGELVLTLAAEWEVRTFVYDWRKDLAIAASELETQIREWFPRGAPVHLVAHGMGGLVGRLLAAQYPKRWAAMADEKLERGGRLIMLGTPNHGTPGVAAVLAGAATLVQKLAALDLAHTQAELRDVFASFPSLYQLLPSPVAGAETDALYRAGTWGELDVAQSALDIAREQHELLSGPTDGRMVAIAGVGQPTVTAMEPKAPGDAAAYRVTWDGDGRVPWASAGVAGAPTYYVEASAAELLGHRDVLRALPELLATGATGRLHDRPALGPRGGDPEAVYRDALETDIRDLDELVNRQARPGDSRGSRHLGPMQEHELEDLIARGIVAGAPQAEPEPAPRPAEIRTVRAIEVTIVHRGIHEDHGDADALAVGHYVDVPPQAAEAALDCVLSGHDPAAGREVPESERLLNAFTQRGVLAGRLAEVFFLPDPRNRDRLVALAGMGEPGRFGVPELVVLARELCWSVARLGKRHLTSVLIGAGNGNLSLEEAVEGWLRGIGYAMSGAPDEMSLQRITFVEDDPRKIPRIHQAMTRLADELHAIRYAPPSDFAALKQAAYERDRAELDRQWASALGSQNGPALRGRDTDPIPTRITLSLDGGTYRYGAITEDASVPERAIPLDPELVHDANDELAKEQRLRRQAERGAFLGRLLLPRDLAAHLDGNAPIVMLLDDATARINWEMVAVSAAGAPLPGSDSATGAGDDALDRFLGTSRGFTRQLRTRLAPPPDPPPPPRRILRVLVIADPAEDRPLLGAQQEGRQVADWFAEFNGVWADTQHRVEVSSLIGPYEATRTNVLRHLMSSRYDVLHYAGHCAYEPADPSRSGWIFTGDRRLTTNELSRVDRIPKFVFSNACESGVTADDPGGATTDLAPGFAHAFFARGVSNFVCTAWPVNDRAALDFARVLYRALLALPAMDGGPRPGRAAAMHDAMRRARTHVARMPRGRLTWGAYQHYGNPHFRLFDRLEPPAPATVADAGRAISPPAGDRSPTHGAAGPDRSPARATRRI